MKLFRVEVTKVVYVLAESRVEAEDDGPDHATEDVGYESVFANEVNEFKDVDKEWRDSIPYGADGSMTVRQWFERPIEPVPFVDPPEQLRFGFDQK